MTNRIADISLRQAALVAGFGYLIIFVFGGFASFSGIVVPADAAATAANIMASESLFRMGIASWLFALTADAIVAWALYVFLKPVSKSLSLLAAWLRLVFVAVFVLNQLNLVFAWQLLSGADYFTVFEPDQLHAQAMLFLNAYEYGMHISFIFFGLHIFVIGYLIFKSDYIPRILGVLLIIASVGYQIDSFGNFLSSNYANNEALFIVFVAVPAVIAEFSLNLWLLIRGGKVKQQDNLAPASP